MLVLSERITKTELGPSNYREKEARNGAKKKYDASTLVCFEAQHEPRSILKMAKSMPFCGRAIGAGHLKIIGDLKKSRVNRI